MSDFTLIKLRDGREVKAVIEQMPEPPVSRQALIQLLTGALTIITGETGKLYRDDWTERARKALALERGARR